MLCSINSEEFFNHLSFIPFFHLFPFLIILFHRLWLTIMVAWRLKASQSTINALFLSQMALFRATNYQTKKCVNCNCLNYTGYYLYWPKENLYWPKENVWKFFFQKLNPRGPGNNFKKLMSDSCFTQKLTLERVFKKIWRGGSQNTLVLNSK